MTKKDFKAAMLRGLGRCVYAVQQEPEKYRDIVLWACKRDIAYDAQSEGTRSWYVYTLASSYPDKYPFIHAAAEALKKYRPNSSWDLLHLTELLMFFAQDGYEIAHHTVAEKYREMLAAMQRRKRRPKWVFDELSDLEQLGLVLAVDRASFLRIAGDFGSLYREKKYMESGDFSWFFEAKGKRYRKDMEQAAQQDPDIARFLKREQESVAAIQANREQRKTDSLEALTGIRLSWWLANHADAETRELYAQAYRQQTQPELRGKSLAAFSDCPYPGDPHSLIEDACSDCEELRNAAWRALEYVRDPAVREFALKNAHDGVRSPENFALLVTNYMPQDAELLEKLLQERIKAKDWDDVHIAGMDIGRAFYRDSKIPHPKHLLPLLYEYTPCSYCRESVVENMAKHRMLTKALLEECRYDSNCDIRSYAEKRLNR